MNDARGKYGDRFEKAMKEYAREKYGYTYQPMEEVFNSNSILKEPTLITCFRWIQLYKEYMNQRYSIPSLLQNV